MPENDFREKVSKKLHFLPGFTSLPIVPVIRLSGVIGISAPLREGLSMASVAPALEAAFSVRGAKAVALVINSPGGSPAQSNLIFSRIRALAEEKDLPVFAFAEDAAASGGYMLACAADEIFADPFSVIGSIGVVSSGFGFTEAIAKLGVERRIHTAGTNKAMLDPFLPEDPDDVKRLETLQRDIHRGFKDLVRGRRGERLQAGERKLFSGEFWTANQALKLGLIDGLGDVRSVMRERYGEDVRLPVISTSRPWWRRSAGAAVAQQTATHSGMSVAGWADDLIGAVEARFWWLRIGL
ncbi:MAG TPA: S49 family peptidase [Rhodobiaceae bacterium]|nr:S49 family peptidase [Rhodobiaceae bacterium]